MRPVPSSSTKSCVVNTSATTPCSHARLNGPHPASKKRASLADTAAGTEDDEDDDETGDGASDVSISRACSRRPTNIFRVDVTAAFAWHADGGSQSVRVYNMREEEKKTLSKIEPPKLSTRTMVVPAGELPCASALF